MSQELFDKNWAALEGNDFIGNEKNAIRREWQDGDMTQSDGGCTRVKVTPRAVDAQWLDLWAPDSKDKPILPENITEPNIIVLGSGLGLILEQLELGGYEGNIFAIELNARVAYASMYHFDWQKWLENPKHFYCVTNALHSIFATIDSWFGRNDKRLLDGFNVIRGDSYVYQPIGYSEIAGRIGFLYDTELERKKFFDSSIHEPPKIIKGEPCRIMLLFPEHVLDFFEMDAKKLGHEVRRFEPYSEKNLLGDFVSALDEFQPHFCLCRNRRAFDPGWRDKANQPSPRRGEMEKILWEMDIPYASWYCENPFKCGTAHSMEKIRLGLTSPNYHIFSFSKAHTKQLQNLGHDASYLPIGTTNDIWRPLSLSVADEKRFIADVAWAGRTKTNIAGHKKSCVLAAYREMFKMNLLPWQTGLPGWISCVPYSVSHDHIQSLLDTYMEICSEPMVINYGRMCDVINAVKTKTLVHTGDRQMADHFATRFTYATSSYYMAQVVKSLLDFKPKIFGGDEWKGIIGDYQKEYPLLNIKTETPKMFNGARININVTKWELDDAIHERVFNCAACGGFIITDYRDTVREFFSEDILETYSSFSELHDKVEYWLKNSKGRRNKADMMRHVVLENHTMKNRCAAMVNIMRERFYT